MQLQLKSSLEKNYCTALAIALSWLFLFCSAVILVPAHPGADQNGYLVGGKLLAQNGSMALRTENINTGKQNPFLFVGHMWVGFDLNSADQRYYPKYPVGLPAVVATVFKIAGPDRGIWLAYWISPVCVSLALLAVFFLVRIVAHPLLALLSSLLMSANPIVLNVSNNPNSHAVDLACVTWGMYFLFSWWRKKGYVRAIVAGFLLGFSVSVRYTDALLLFPLVLVVFISHTAEKSPRYSKLQPTLLLLSWALPVLILLSHNIIAFDSLTGYGSTNESTGFAWSHFINNWDTTFQQINGTALVFMFPFAVAGLITMLWWSWRLALVLAAWIIPTILVYTAFYWAPGTASYARYFLSIVPALLMCAFWFLNHMQFADSWQDAPDANPEPGSPAPMAIHANSILSPHSRNPPPLLIASLLALLTFAVTLMHAVPNVVEDYTKRKVLLDAGNTIKTIATPGSIIASGDMNILNHLQFVADFQLYNLDLFDKWSIERLPVQNPNAPQAWQPQQRQALYDRLKDLSQQDLNKKLTDILKAALENKQEVFFIKREENSPRRNRMPFSPSREFSSRVMATWLPAAPKPENRLPENKPGGRIHPHQMAWQLIKITTNPEFDH